MLNERRKDPRLTLQQCVRISLYGLETFIDAEALNISENGILCASSVAIENLEKIVIMVDLDIGGNIRTLRSEGLVMYTHMKDGKHLFGVQFIEVTDETRQLLKDYASAYADDESVSE
jgi:hypothetical protein